MNNPCDCSENTDPLKLVREGTHQVQRALLAPDPALVRVDERRPEHALVFATAYAKYLKYFDLDDVEQGDWQDFFASDVSAQLAVVAIEDIAAYRTTVKALLRSLEDPELPASAPDMIAALGAVFDCLGTFARRLDTLKAGLPADQPLRATLGNLIRSPLSPMLQRLIGYYLAGDALGVVDRTAPPHADVLILGRPVESFEELITGTGLAAAEWPDGVGLVGWAAYASVDPEPYKGAYGSSATAVDEVNHLATHNLFTAVCETFLAVYARVVGEAKAAVQATFEWDGHEPHYALLLAFLQLLEYARDEANELTAKHLEFYYRKVLQLQERPAKPAQAHVLVELAKHVDAHLLGEGTLLKAGKDATGSDAHFSVDRDLVANKGVVADLRNLYRHDDPPPGLLPLDDGRIFASPVANVGESWHPFAEKVYTDGALESIAMPPAEVGFAIASHYLWMAEGTRVIQVVVAPTAPIEPDSGKHLQVDLRCRVTTEKGWIERRVEKALVSQGAFDFNFTIDGNDPPITPYDPKVHGYSFATSMPVLLVTLHHRSTAPWDYAKLEGVRFTALALRCGADGLKTLALSSDVGSIDASKPFLAYGPAPVTDSTLVIGSKEVFQKRLDYVWVRPTWMSSPVALDGSVPNFLVDYLDAGKWQPYSNELHAADVTELNLDDIPFTPVDTPDLTPNEAFATTSRSGFIRLRLTAGFGVADYAAALVEAILTDDDKPDVPVVPTASLLTLEYSASQEIDLTTPQPGNPEALGRFFHVTPFGYVEQLPGQASVPLLPQFLAGPNESAEGELYIGVRGLAPPQNLALLFQVVDGTANPLVVKPDGHARFCYLRGNEWVEFSADAVGDGTDGLLASGIVTLAVPADATTEHTVLPPDLHWVRLAVKEASDAVCRLVTVAAQALPATYVVRADGLVPPTHELPRGTITKLDPPDGAVKGVTQPYSTFGGRPIETPVAFATRISERLRHKDRAIALWDYEHLILEAFPGIYQARCLNHTQYESTTSGTGIYRELAPGHVTIVTIPDLAVPNQRDPLRPFTSLRVLGEIERFLAKRVSCFARLHVRNPQFEEVRVDLRVRFRASVDETFHTNKLKREITQFLSPWAFRSDTRPTFNGKVYKSVLVNFVEERPYVDYVSDVHLFHKLPGATADGPNLDEVVGSRAISILVSVPAEQHGVDVIHPDEVLLPEHCACGPAVS